LVCCIFAVSTTSAQLKGTRVFFKTRPDASLCEDKYILDSLGDFFEINGCEKKTVFLGKYTLKHDTVNFIYKVPKDFPPVLRIEEGPAQNDSLVKITLLSCLGEPISPTFEVDAVETNGRFFKKCTINKKGEIFLNPNQYSSLRLTELDHYYGKWTSVDIKHLDQKIYLSFPEDVFSLSHPVVWFMPSFSALLKADGLYDLTGKKILYYQK
jgi:hypothetical protein